MRYALVKACEGMRMLPQIDLRPHKGKAGALDEKMGPRRGRSFGAGHCGEEQPFCGRGLWGGTALRSRAGIAHSRR